MLQCNELADRFLMGCTWLCYGLGYVSPMRDVLSYLLFRLQTALCGGGAGEVKRAPQGSCGVAKFRGLLAMAGRSGWPLSL